MTKPESGLRHILWDWNGTLLEDVALCVSALNEVSEKRGIAPVSPQRYREIFTFPVIEYYKAVGFNFDREPFSKPADEWVEIYCRRVWNESKLYDGASAVLEFIRQRGLTQSILSAHHHDMLVRLARHFGVLEYLDSIVGQGDFYAEGKLELGRAWLKRSGLQPDAILLIGDTLHDHEVASVLGVGCVLVGQGHQSKDRLLGAGVPVLDSIADVPRFLQR